MTSQDFKAAMESPTQCRTKEAHLNMYLPDPQNLN